MPKSTNALKSVSYFCAEFGIDSNTPTYAGGLGILAGDTLKEAADRDYPMTGIGLLYQGKMFIQRINADGWQTEEVSLYDPASACLRRVTQAGKPLYVTANLGGQEVYVTSYQIRVGDKTNLYLLTSDSHKNPDEWRSIMSADYWGDSEAQIRQQLVLGIGGVKLLEKLKIKTDYFHFNEGRPCFAVWEILSQLMKSEKLSFDQAHTKAKEKIIYTNHTLLKSGNLQYDINLVKKYAETFAQNMGINSDQLVESGRLDEQGQFGITKYSMKTASKITAVSKLHGGLCQKEWPEYKWNAITNGVHLPSWQNTHFRDPNLSDSQIWQVHTQRKHELMKTVERRSGFGYDPSRLIISWARRMAAYKNLDILFEDLDRLHSILSKSDRPMMLLVAGKAHPGDNAAKEHIQKTIKSFSGKLSGFAIFVPNYDIALARAMVQGSDLWLNTPQYGREACGTSGMKAISNGVLNTTVADGWAAEVDWQDTGWVIDHTSIGKSIYNLLENQIGSEFYERSEEGLPIKWITKMKNSIALAKTYSTSRMLDEYTSKLYI